MPFSPRFIVFEGLDGAGKSTLIQKLIQELKSEKFNYELVRDPGSTPVGEKLRQIILDPNEKPCARTEILMYEAARAQLVAEKIAPLLKQGHWVISDRFYSSTIAFQCWARGIDLKEVDWLNRYACDGLEPDLVVYIDITVEESQRRQNQRNQSTGTQPDRMENEDKSFHEKVRLGYLKQAEQNPAGWLVLDGLKTPDQLFADVAASLKDRQWLDS